VTYVIERDGRIAGYYAIAMAGVARDRAPGRPHPRGRPSEVPCVLLARLAVDQRSQGAGVGRALLRDALERSVLLSQSIGAAAVLVHCRDQAAQEFYLRNGDFTELPGDPLVLMVPLKALRRYQPAPQGGRSA
jgi:GNAT superfamily N-acetyltransferase